MLADFEAVGAQINLKKSFLTPSKCLRFLGMLVDTQSYRFFVPADKVEKPKVLVGEMVTVKQSGGDPEATFRQLARVLGRVLIMWIAISAMAMMTHDCYSLL